MRRNGISISKYEKCLIVLLEIKENKSFSVQVQEFNKVWVTVTVKKVWSVTVTVNKVWSVMVTVTVNKVSGQMPFAAGAGDYCHMSPPPLQPHCSACTNFAKNSFLTNLLL